MSDDRPAIVICVEWKDEGLAKGSEKRSCQDCGASISVAPSTIEFGKTRELKLLCQLCAIKSIVRADADVELRNVPGSVREMIKHFSSDN